MSVCLTKTEIIGGSVDGTVRTFDIRIGRYGRIFVDVKMKNVSKCWILLLMIFFVCVIQIENYPMIWANLSIVSRCQMMVTAY